MKILKTSLFTLVLMASSVAFGQVYADFDLDQTGGVDRHEFDETYSDNFDQWDRNQDGTVDDREFYDTTYDRLDTNSDEYLDADEWNRGYDNLYGDYLGTRDNTQFDADRDQRISRDEYYSGMRNTEYFNTYDTNRDRTIDRDEMNEGTFNSWDQNEDGTLDRNEFNARSSYFIDDGR